MLEPCVMLADDASRARDVSTEHGMVRVAAEKVHTASCRQASAGRVQPTWTAGVSDGVERLGKIQ